MIDFFKFKHILIIIIVIQIFSSSIFMYLGHYQYTSILEMHTKHETIRANKIYKNVFSEVNKVYSVLSENILTNEVVEAFADRDRSKLYTLVFPKFKALQKLNKYVENIHFHTDDMYSFLRLHKPGVYGDDLRTFRPMIVKENELRTRLYGLETGKHGVLYRIVLPVYKNGLFIGSMELGIDIRFLIKRLNQFSELKSYMFLEKDETMLIHKYDREKAKEYLLEYDDEHELVQYYENAESKDFLKLIGKNIIDREHYKIVEKENKMYLLNNGLALENFENKHIGSIVFLQEIDYYFDTVATVRWISIITTLMLLLFSIVLIYILIKKHTNSMHLKEKELMSLASMDQLTKIGNRYSFNKTFTNEFKVNSRNDTSMTFLMVDIDNFKQYNDNYGHPSGDKVLKTIAQSMKNLLQRPSDYLFRIGGEEFVILYSGLSYSDSVRYAQTIIDNINELNIEHTYNKPYGNITISIGLYHVEKFLNIDEESIYKAADEVLYEAKKIGKNRLVSRQYT